MMRLQEISLKNFRAINTADIKLDGKSTVIFGINGTGKSSILRSINLLFANIINQVVNRKELKQNYAIQLEDIMFGRKETNLHANIDFDGEIFGYSHGMIRNTGRKTDDKKSLDKIAAIFHEKYVSDEEQKDIPIFANYGTNRLVLDIPLRIRTHHTFDIYSAFEKAIENKIDFRTFFEWYRDQEDFENETKIETGDLSYKDNALLAVRRAILAMLDDCSNLRVVRKPRLEMKIDKQNMSLNVSQMSDGEKCTLALFGDLARRLTLANPNKQDPLLGEGIVLIDEIETHLHLELQRVILPILTTIFPNIQFVVTTHSPFILNSLENAVAFDLEHREPIEDLTDYSYEALAEGYFGVRTDSSEIQMRLQRMEELIRSDRLSISDKSELEMYLQDFDKIPEAVAPAIKAKYYDLKREWQNKN